MNALHPSILYAPFHEFYIYDYKKLSLVWLPYECSFTLRGTLTTRSALLLPLSGITTMMKQTRNICRVLSTRCAGRGALPGLKRDTSR